MNKSNSTTLSGIPSSKGYRANKYVAQHQAKLNGIGEDTAEKAFDLATYRVASVNIWLLRHVKGPTVQLLAVVDGQFQAVEYTR